MFKINNLYLKAFINRYTKRMTKKFIQDKLWLYPMPPEPGTFWRHKLQKDLVIQVITPEDFALRQLKEYMSKPSAPEYSGLVRTAVAYNKDDSICFRALKDESINFIYDDEEIKHFYDWFVELGKEEAAMEVLKHV